MGVETREGGRSGGTAEGGWDITVSWVAGID